MHYTSRALISAQAVSAAFPHGGFVSAGARAAALVSRWGRLLLRYHSGRAWYRTKGQRLRTDSSGLGGAAIFRTIDDFVTRRGPVVALVTQMGGLLLLYHSGLLPCTAE
jgi:hypothetical protein